jgi:hypothetical protein
MPKINDKQGAKSLAAAIAAQVKQERDAYKKALRTIANGTADLWAKNVATNALGEDSNG